MGVIIDLEGMKTAYRCNHVKLAIVIINLIGAPLSLFFLVLGIFRMIFAHKKITFLTSLIILIFSSEIVNCISKLIQLIKYMYEDKRDDKTIEDINTPRGIICQIQIVTSIYSDFCSLLATSLLSLRCYDVIKNKIRFFDKGNNRIYSIVFVILLSIIISISFLFIDRKISDVSYRFDVRDRCSYWCWLEHISSIICYLLYLIILIINIVLARKTNNYLKKGIQTLLEENNICEEENNNDNKNLLNGNSKENDLKKYSNLTNEEQKRIEELKLMRKKCLIYPNVTIGIWTFATIYRFLDTIIMYPYDHGNDPEELNKEEARFFDEYPFFQFLVQTLLVLHTFVSATRGLFYGFSFIVFEEKLFFNFFRRCFSKNNLKNNEEEQKQILIDSSRASENDIKNNEDNEEKNEDNLDKDSMEMNSSQNE